MEQLGAADTVIEYIRISDEVSSSLDADSQPLTDIITGQNQTIEEGPLTENRRKDQVQTDTTVVHITDASEPVEFDDVCSVGIQMYTDAGKIDVIGSATGKSVVPVDQPQYLQLNVNAVKTEADWRFGDVTDENALRCPV